MSAVVVAYVPGSAGEAALREGAAEARRRDTRLVVVNATRGDALVDARYLQGEARAALEDRLAQLDVPAELRSVDTRRDIVDDLRTVSEEVGAVVLVIGLRRRSQVGKMIMGSAATRILMHASVPVLTVRG